MTVRSSIASDIEAAVFLEFEQAIIDFEHAKRRVDRAKARVKDAVLRIEQELAEPGAKEPTP